MDSSTLLTLLLTTPFAQALLPLAQQLLAPVQHLGQTIARFHQSSPTPSTTYQFECEVQTQLREIGRRILEWTSNHVEAEDRSQQPARFRVGLETYRCRDKTPNTIATCFGPITLHRYLYEPLSPREPCLHPLENALGIEGGNATPAFAERVGQWAVHHPQRTLLTILEREYGVHWSCGTLRTVTAAISEGMAEHRQEAQVDRVLHLLGQAFRSRGRHRPVLAVGRDGGNLPLRGDGYHEGSVGTIAVYDRRDRRRGTVYLSQMPESGQVTLSQQLTALLKEVLERWSGPLPRFAYVSDGGQHEEDYYERVLAKLTTPHQLGQRLGWVRVLDYYHASSYVSQMAEALFGESPEARKWSHRMRQWLLVASRGISRVLQSASAHRNLRDLSEAAAQQYEKAYHYLRSRTQWMNYARYRRLGVPLGSGVTEAACKTVFTYRMKQSGMSWEIEGGQVILDLRVLYLSQVWKNAHQRHLKAKGKDVPLDGTRESRKGEPRKKAA